LDGGDFGATSYVKYSRTDMFLTKILTVGADVAEIPVSAQQLCFPNPTAGSFVVDMSKFKGNEFQVSLQDCLGRCISKNNGATGRISFDLSAEPKGVYFIEIISDKYQYREKIVVQ
jgi:hypothetical protein